MEPDLLQRLCRLAPHRRIVEPPAAHPYGDALWPIPALGIGYGETKIVECHDFFRSVVDGTPATPHFGDGYQIARICEAIEESAASGEWTSVPALEPVTT